MIVEKEKVTTDLSAFFEMFQKFTKGVCMIRSMILQANFLDINADFVRVSIPKCTSFHGKKDGISPWQKNSL